MRNYLKPGAHMNANFPREVMTGLADVSGVVSKVAICQTLAHVQVN